MSKPSTPSGALAVGTTVVCGTSALLRSMILVAGSAASTITIYDNASAASGTVVAAFAIAASSTWSHDFAEGVCCNKGITAVVSGTAAVAYVMFERE